MERQHQLATLEKQIIEHCDSVTNVTTGIFLLSMFLTILRPDPTLVVCLFGFYGAKSLCNTCTLSVRAPGKTYLNTAPASGAHVRSSGAIRSFWFFTMVTMLVDALWLLAYSPLRPIEFDVLKQMSRKDQASAPLGEPNARTSDRLLNTACGQCGNCQSLSCQTFALSCAALAALCDPLGPELDLQAGRRLVGLRALRQLHEA